MSASKPAAVSYVPAWSGPVEGYAVNYATRNLWKVRSGMEREDLVQEAYLVFMKCSARYPELDTPQHFMALFKTALMRRVCDLASADSAYRERHCHMGERYDDDGDAISLQEPVGELQNEGILATVLRQAPSEVLLVLRLFLSAPQEMLEIALAPTQREDARSRHIGRLLGLPEGFDALGAVRSYFSETAA